MFGVSKIMISENIEKSEFENFDYEIFQMILENVDKNSLLNLQLCSKKTNKYVDKHVEEKLRLLYDKREKLKDICNLYMKRKIITNEKQFYFMLGVEKENEKLHCYIYVDEDQFSLEFEHDDSTENKDFFGFFELDLFYEEIYLIDIDEGRYFTNEVNFEDWIFYVNLNLE